jgi:hypothetical protein
MLIAALQAWSVGTDPHSLPELVEGFFGTLAWLTTDVHHEESPS